MLSGVRRAIRFIFCGHFFQVVEVGFHCGVGVCIPLFYTCISWRNVMHVNRSTNHVGGTL